MIDSKLQDTSKDILDLTLEKGMNLTIVLPDFYDDFTNKYLWSNMSTLADSIGGIIPSNYPSKYKGNFSIEADTDYILKLYIKPTHKFNSLIIYIRDNNTGKTIASTGALAAKLQEENLFYWSFNSKDFTGNDVSIIIENGDGNMLVNDISLTKLRENKIPESEPNNVIKGERQIAPKTDHKKAITVDTGGSNPNNVSIVGYISQPQQRWIFEYDISKKAYIIKSKLNNKVLAWDSKNGNNVVVQDYNSNSAEQYWIPEMFGIGSYVFKNYKDTNKVLGFNGYNSLKEMNIEVQQRNNSNNQL